MVRTVQFFVLRIRLHQHLLELNDVALGVMGTPGLAAAAFVVIVVAAVAVAVAVETVAIATAFLDTVATCLHS